MRTPPASTGSAPGAGRPGAPSSLARALTLIHTGQVTRRVELTERLGLTRTATGTLLAQLEHLGLVRTARAPADAASPSRPPEPGTGRPSHVVAVHPRAPGVVAVHVQAESVLVAGARLGGELGPVTEVALPRPPDPQPVVHLVARLVARHLDATPGRQLGVGVAMVSPVGHDGSALAALPLAWPTGVPLQRSLRAQLDGLGHRLPVSVGNDANLAALAEYRHGAGAGAGDMLYLTTGQRGVGGALVVHGRLHTGSAGYALEVGHLTVRPGGRPCHCGNAGCLDVEADPTALRAHQQHLADRLAALKAIVPPLATGLAGLVNVLNPDRIVLGGLHAELLAAVGDLLRDELASRSFLQHAGQVHVVAGGLPHPGLAGAAEAAFQPLLDDPRGTLLAWGADAPDGRPPGPG